MTPEDRIEATEPLRVISKSEWLQWKAKLRELTDEMKKVSGPKFLSEEKHDLKPNTLLKLSGFGLDTVKSDIKIAVKHFSEPAFVDYV